MQAQEVRAYGAKEMGAPLEKMTIKRRAVGPKDVSFDVKYSGICHSDVSQVKGEWGANIFPMVPGHELVGEVVAVGSDVTRFKVGDRVGVGCMVGSCKSCKHCDKSLEQYCLNGGCTFTYNGKYRDDKELYGEDAGQVTYGGYSQNAVINEAFVVKVPDSLDLAGAAPLLCAGITTYSPLRHYGLKAGQRLGVAGLGGLGHMAVKFGLAMGASVVVLSRGTAKKDDAKALGAHEYVDTKDETAVKDAAASLDMIIDTIGVQHDVNLYLGMLALDGKLVLVGVPPNLDVSPFNLLAPRRQVVGSLIGGMEETQEMLDFCGEKGITADIEMVRADQINEAYERMLKSDVKYRFVIDGSTF